MYTGLGANPFSLSLLPLAMHPYYTIREMLWMMDRNMRPTQTDLSTQALQQLNDSGRGEDVWPARGGPWMSSYDFGPSPYKVSDFNDEMTALASDYNAVYFPPQDQPQVAPGSLPFEGDVVSPEYRGPFQRYISPDEMTFSPTVIAANPAITPGGVIVGTPGGNLPPGEAVVSPLSPAGGTVESGFPVWGWVALGVGAYALLRR